MKRGDERARTRVYAGAQFHVYMIYETAHLTPQLQLDQLPAVEVRCCIAAAALAVDRGWRVRRVGQEQPARSCSRGRSKTHDRALTRES
eukprot:74308-Pelagomonas_calceolata.AAC.3